MSHVMEPVTPPVWVLPGPFAVDDVQVLAFREWADEESWLAAGVALTVTWVLGARPAPVTGRSKQPVGRAIAESEFWAAQTQCPMPLPVALLESTCRQLGVAFVEPRPTHPEAAFGVWRTLRWLLGKQQGPPVDVPLRDERGRVLADVDLFARMVEERPHAIPEQRAEWRLQAAREAERSARLADRATETAMMLGFRVS